VEVEVEEGAERVVLARAADLETALGNLVDNAARVSPPGAPVRVIVAARPGRAAAVVVEDQGPGIPAAIAPRVFERFFTTDPDRGGTGLGLAIVRAIAERHGGRVTVQGSRFTIALPASHGSLKDRP
jgi:signal transduction histidine kinase